MLEYRFTPPAGFSDYWGNHLRARDYISAKLSSYLQSCGYTRLSFPLIEKQDYFSKEMVGSTPWPGWHPKSLFNLQVKDYDIDYGPLPDNIENCVLIREGTTSVCRWVAARMQDDKVKIERGRPVKIFYNTPCFRNEIVKELNGTKQREFTQIGVEYLGISNTNADIEIIYNLYQGLIKLGLLADTVRIRISDVRLFNYLVRKQEIPKHMEDRLKILLDKVASAKAKGDKSQITRVRKNIISLLKEGALSKKEIKDWELLILDTYFNTSDIKKLQSTFPEEVLNNLAKITNFFEAGKQNVVIDLSIVRSQEYYSSLTFQADLLLANKCISEVAGGGRYDEFVGKFLRRYSSNGILRNLPGTGFALSLERILAFIGHSSIKVEGNVYFFSGQQDVDIVLFSRNLKKAFEIAETLREKNNRVEVYLANSSKRSAMHYAEDIGAKLISLE